MSAKLLQALTDENPDLQKQIGCMTGIFQLFDRHHIITGKRIDGHSHKKLPSARPHFNNGNLGTEANACSSQTAMNQSQSQKVSAESSRTSFSSSSCSSSYSSLDYIKTGQPEAPSFDRSIFSEQSSKTGQKFHLSHSDNRPNVSISSNDKSKSSPGQLARQSLDFRDVVKDSIYREIRGSLVKTQTRDDLPRPQNSPRPVQLPKSVEGPAKIGVNSKPRIPVDLNESLRVLSKLKEAPWYFTESRDPPRSSYESRDGPFHSSSKDAPRFSFDGREIHRRSLDSRDAGKSSSKPRELPRLSLDSREYSSKGSNFDMKSNLVSKDLQRSNLNLKKFSNGVPNLQQEPGNSREPPSVVARLMGLEAMPNSKSGADFDCFGGEKNGSYTFGLSEPEKNREDPISCSPKSSLKDSISPRLRNSDSVMRPICSSRFPIEPAPWRQQESSPNPQKPGFRARELNIKPPASQFVYSEVEKRLKDLEFQHSDKDLRTLKQLLDVMEAKGLLAGKKQEDGRASNFPIQRNFQNQNRTGIDQSVRFTNKQNTQFYRPISPQTKGNCSPKVFESPIVIMKPAKFMNKASTSPSSVIPVDGLSVLRSSKLVGEYQTGNPSDRKKVSTNNRTARDPTPKINHREPVAVRVPESKTNGKIEENSLQKPRSRSNQTSPRSQLITKENSNSSVKNSGSSSPRLQNKRTESERKIRIPPASPDSSKPRRQSEAGSPGRKTRSTSNSIHSSQTEDQLSEISSETRNSSRQVDEISLQSDSNISLASQADIEVTSINRSEELDLNFAKHDETVSVLKQKKSSLNLSEDSSSSMESTAAAPEQPSPVSVLDPSFYRDEMMPSPVKKIPVPFKEDDDLSVEDGRNPADSNAVIDRKKLESIDSLVQKLRRLGSDHDTSKAATQPSVLLCDAANPDHQYVSEILLASGFLLQDLGSDSTPIRLHLSGHPINPDLFLVLEQTNASRLHKAEPAADKRVPQSKSNPEKLRRKLLFDMVNEILGEKLEPAVSQYEPWIQTNKLARRVPTGQQLLRELCQEIDKLGVHGSADDVEDWHRLENWTDFSGENSSLVLDVERLVFKDLVDEILSGEAWSHGAKPSRRRRQLFAN